MKTIPPTNALYRVGYWATPPLMAIGSWVIGLFLPDHTVNWVMIQAILLSAPPFFLLIWPVWALALAHRFRGRFIFCWLLTPWWFGIPDACRDQAGGDVTILAANVNAYSGSVEQIESALSKELVDVIIAVEKRPLSIEGMRLAAHNFDEDVGRPSHHSAVFCRYECEAQISPEYGSDTMKMPIASVRMSGNICLLGVHSPPPAPIDATGLRPYVQVLIDMVENGHMAYHFGACKAGDTVLVLGDLNAVPGSWAHRSLTKEGLVDRRSHSGLFGLTWPNGGGFINFPMMRLDHLLIGRDVVARVRPVELPGSDHIGIKVWLRSD